MSAVMIMAPTRMVSIRSSATVKPRAASTVCRVAPKAACVRAPVRMMPTQFGVNPTHALFNSATSISTGSAARKVVVTKAAEGAVVPSAPKKENMLVLGALFAGWYAFNIYFNIYNKQILTVFPYPWTNTNFQFLGGTVIALTGWATGMITRPTTLTSKQLLAIVPLALVHTLGNLLTNVSLGKVAVSFTHTIKAMEPFFSVVLSSIFLGDAPTLPIILALCPIVGGVVLASVSEVSFNWIGFLAAMGSNLTFQSRNVLSKKVLSGDLKKGLDNINLFSIITVMSFFILAPFTLLVEGMVATPAVMTSMGLDSALIFKRLIYAAFCFHMYQQVSYVILSKVTPVTHSVGNSVKRVVVIVSTVIFFRTPVSFMNGLGTAIALMGVVLYSQVKRLEGKKKEA